MNKLNSLVALLALCATVSAQVSAPNRTLFQRVARQQLCVATSNGFTSGAAVALHGGPPWSSEPLGATQGGQLMRVFDQDLFVVNTYAGTISWMRLDTPGSPVVIDFGALSEPQDICVSNGVGWVSLRADPVLRRVDLGTGIPTSATNLQALAAPGESITLGTLARDGNRLFVQVTLTHEGAAPGPFLDRGVLAVLSLPSGTLIDVDPVQPGVQGVALDGAPPHHKMQILDQVRTLYVSSTNGWMDSRGGIEMVDLRTLQSVGYALSEQQIADLGGFVMTSPAGGYFMFHTDITPSTHLMPFTVSEGPGRGPEMVVLFDVVDRLAYDPKRKRIYLPSGFGAFSSPGVHAFSTVTNAPVGVIAFAGATPPYDVVLADR